MKAINRVTQYLRIKYITLALFIIAMLLVASTLTGLHILNRTLQDIIVVHHERTLLVSHAMMQQQVTLREDLLPWAAKQSAGLSEDDNSAVMTTFFDGGIVVYDQQQNLLWHSPLAIDSSWLTNKSATRELILVDDTQWVVLRHVLDNGQSIAGAFSLDTINVNPIFDDPIDHHFELYLTNGDNDVLLSPNRPSEYRQVYLALLGSSNQQPIQQWGRETYLVSTDPFLVPDITLTAILPWQYVTDIAFRRILLVNMLPLTLLFVTLSFIILLYVGLNDIVRPLRLLGQQTFALVWGNYDAIHNPVGGIAAIRELQNTLINMADQLRRSESYRQGYVSAVIQAQEEERLRIARDLHDETVQSLIVLGHNLESIERLLTKNPKQVLQKLQNLQNTNRQTINEIRRIIRDMRPTYLTDLGLVAALKKLCRDYENTNDFTMIANLPTIVSPLSPDLEVVLYRICQEALSNAAKHASASEVRVTLNITDHVLLKIEDNGKGFKVPQHPLSMVADHHFGLVTIVERVRMISGTLSIDSSTHMGTRLTIQVPQQPTPEND